MGIGRLSSFIRRLRGSLAAAQPGGLSDAALLDRWLALRDEAAFEVLLWRHGPMVLGVCRRVLGNDADVEDAFQAAFLLLVRKAAAIRRRESVAAWLYQVAYRVALRARERSGARSARETCGVDALAAAEGAGWDDMRPVLDDEIRRLPAKYRTPFIRCYLEGCTNEEAAAELGCPVGTIHSRLAWARERLRSRLTRRGVTLTMAGLTVLLTQNVAPAGVPAVLADTTLHAAFAYAANSATAAGVSAGAVALTKGVLRSMFLEKLRLGAAVVLALVVCGGAGGLAFFSAAGAAHPPRGGERTPSPTSAPVPQQPAAPRTIKVPSEVEGKLLGLFTEIQPGEQVGLKDIVVVGNTKYRRLREGDTIAEGQLLARVDDAVARDDVRIQEAKVQAAEADLLTASKTKDEAKMRYDRMVKANEQKPGIYSAEDISGAKLSWDRYLQEEATKKATVIVAQAQLNQSKTQLERYMIRSPVAGVIKTIQVQKGEAVQRLGTVVEILPAEEK
jgi:RNA polymerase sigma factor (sigma-70 family)